MCTFVQTINTIILRYLNYFLIKTQFIKKSVLLLKQAAPEKFLPKTFNIPSNAWLSTDGQTLRFLFLLNDKITSAINKHFIKTSFFVLLKLAGRQWDDTYLHGEWSIKQLAKCSGEKWYYKGNSELSKHEDYWLYTWVNLCKIKA